MFMLFTCDQNGNLQVRGFIEGDDGIFRMKGTPPDSSKFAKLGLVIKIVKFKELNHASFCGLVFDINDRTNVTDPIKQVVNFGWTTKRYARSKKGVHMCLLKAKALSMLYQYPACPILTALGLKIMQLTASYDVKSFLDKHKDKMYDVYKVGIINEALQRYLEGNLLTRRPGTRTRLLVEELYGVTMSHQYEIEQYFGSLKTIEELDHPLIEFYLKPEWKTYHDSYAVRLNLASQWDNFWVPFPQMRKEFNPLIFA